jgi:excisionase family DNA binding protein
MTKLLTVEELSELIRTPIATIHQWTHQRKIPFYKIGRRCFFKEDEILQWIETKRQGKG